jgi:hypothetical protein
MSRAHYPSDSYATNKARRLRRIKRRAVGELTRAFEGGTISLRQFDRLSQLPVSKQRRQIAAQQWKSDAALLAAETIHLFLDNLQTGSPVRLQEVVGAISSAVAHAPKAHESRL